MKTDNLMGIVDDSADFRLLLSFIFKMALPDCPVRLFESGQALLDALQQPGFRPRVILLDRHMPDMNGHQTLLALKQHPDYKKIPVVMMSAEPRSAEVDDCYGDGASGFICKSPDVEGFQAKLIIFCHYWFKLNERLN